MRVVFQTGRGNVQCLAREDEPLTAHDLRNLQARQVAIGLCVKARTEPPLTRTTCPAPRSLAMYHARELVQVGLSRCGRPGRQGRG